MAEGIQLRLTHTGTSASNLMFDDLLDARGKGQIPEYIYLPAPTTTVPNPTVTLTYGGRVPLSFERGDIRGYINRGLITAEFLIGGEVQKASAGTRIVTSTAGAPSPDVAALTVDDSLILVDTTNDAVRLNLPDGTEHLTKRVTIIDIGGNAAVNNIAVFADATDTITGGASDTLAVNNGQAEYVFYTPGTDWFAIAEPSVTDGSAIHDDTAGEIAGVALKGVPVNADLLLIEDSADGNNKKRITIGSLPGGGAVDPTDSFYNLAAATFPGPYAASVGDLVEADATGGPFDVNLPAGAAAGTRVTINKIDATANIVTVNGNGTNISGVATFPLPNQYDSLTVVRGTAQWFII